MIDRERDAANAAINALIAFADAVGETLDERRVAEIAGAFDRGAFDVAITRADKYLRHIGGIPAERRDYRGRDDYARKISRAVFASAQRRYR